MRYAAPPPTPTPARLDALASMLHGGLLLFVAWIAEHLAILPLAEHLRADVDRRLRCAARCAEEIVFLQAVHRLGDFRPSTHAKHSGRHGFRAQRWLSTHARRRLIRIADIHRGALHERAERITQLLASPGAAIARAERRLRNGDHGADLQVCAPPAQALHVRQVPASAFADTS